MICRVAGSCFWLHRYVERAENTARLLEVTRTFAIDMDPLDAEPWEGPLVASDERRRFVRARSAAAVHDGDAVQDFLTWDEENPVSILNSTRYARENARVIREIISPEMWEALNGFWHWLNGKEGRKTFRRERDAFFARIRESASLFQGACHDTMLHEEPFDFMRLGILLERCGQTARILNARHHVATKAKTGPGTPLEASQSMALLRSCSASQSFFRLRRGGLTAGAVAEFLIGEVRFPRSVHHCLDRAWNFITRLRPRRKEHVGRLSARRIDQLLREVRNRPKTGPLTDLRAECDRIIAGTDAICVAIRDDYFSPSQAGLRRAIGAGQA